MPLWSTEEWRARIGGSWCAIGRPFCIPRKQEKGNSQLFGVLYDYITSLLLAMLTTLVVCTRPTLCEMSDCKVILILSKFHLSLAISMIFETTTYMYM